MKRKQMDMFICAMLHKSILKGKMSYTIGEGTIIGHTLVHEHLVNKIDVEFKRTGKSRILKTIQDRISSYLV